MLYNFKTRAFMLEKGQKVSENVIYLFYFKGRRFQTSKMIEMCHKIKWLKFFFYKNIFMFFFFFFFSYITFSLLFLFWIHLLSFFVIRKFNGVILKCALCQWRLLSVQYSLFFLHSREHSEMCRLYANACAFNSSRGAIDGEINNCDVKWRLIDLIYPLLEV